MTDFWTAMSHFWDGSFWSGWVMVIAVINYGIVLFLFLWAPWVKIPTVKDGTTGHVWANGAIREGLARRIRETMKHRGLSGADLARRLGVSQPTVHAWINAGHGLRRQNIRRLAAELAVDPAWLEFGADREAEARAADAAELAFLRLYRELDDEGQAVVLRRMTALQRGGKPRP